MNFTKFIKDMDIISLLDNAPNDVGGLTAEELKGKFDEGGKAIKDFINNVLLVELKKYTDEAPSPKDLEDIYDAIHEVVLGQIPDGTITEAKIADGAVSEKKLAPGTLDGALPKVSMNAPTAADNIAAGYPIGKTWLRPNYTLTNLAYDKDAEAFTVVACAVSKGGQTFTIAGNGDDKVISAELNHGSANDWLYCVVTPDATAASASLIVGGETVALTVGEANTIQRRYTGESIKFEATYDTANVASTGTITVANLTIIDEAATLAQVDESCRDVSDNTVFDFVLGNLPLDSVGILNSTWQHLIDGGWAEMPVHNTMDLLWENASPTSAFAAQTISVDFSKYDLIAIEHYSPSMSTYQYTGSSYAVYGFEILRCDYAHNGFIMASTWGSGGQGQHQSHAKRIVQIKDNSLWFSAAKGHTLWATSSGSSNVYEQGNNNCIPVKIYGIKGAVFA